MFSSLKKWQHRTDDEDILLIESVAHEMMTRLGYETAIVGKTRDALTFTDEQIAEFKRLNEEGIHHQCEHHTHLPESFQRH